MGKLTEQQIEAAEDAFFNSSGCLRTATAKDIEAIAPHVQFPIESPTKEEIHEICAAGSCTWVETEMTIKRFIGMRAYARQPKPTKLQQIEQVLFDLVEIFDWKLWIGLVLVVAFLTFVVVGSERDKLHWRSYSASHHCRAIGLFSGPRK
jgi:hypothetical protein